MKWMLRVKVAFGPLWDPRKKRRGSQAVCRCLCHLYSAVAQCYEAMQQEVVTILPFFAFWAEEVLIGEDWFEGHVISKDGMRYSLTNREVATITRPIEQAADDIDQHIGNLRDILWREYNDWLRRVRSPAAPDRSSPADHFELAAAPPLGNGNAAVPRPPEVSYTGKLNYLWHTWKITRGLMAIARNTSLLLRAVAAPLLKNLAASLSMALDSLGDMSATEPPRDKELVCWLECDLRDALRLTSTLKMLKECQKATWHSLAVLLLGELDAALRRALIMIVFLDGRMGNGAALWDSMLDPGDPYRIAEEQGGGSGRLRLPAPPGDRTAATEATTGGTPLAGSGRAPRPQPPPTPADRPELVAAPPSGNGTAATNDRTSEAPAGLTPPARALAAAYELQREGKPVSLRTACERARVDRAHLRRRYPDAVKAIEDMARPDRSPRRGCRDRRTGNIDPLDDRE